MALHSGRGINRRRMFTWGGSAAAGVAVGALAGAELGHADPAPKDSDVPKDSDLPPGTKPGGAYDQYVAKLAADGTFSGVVMLAYKGRTVLSRSYGMADKENGIPNRADTAFNLSSAGKPFHSVAVLQLVQQGRASLTDTVGTHLKGFPQDVAEQVTIHHLLTGSSGLVTPKEDVQRVFQSRDEVREYYEQWVRQAKVGAAPGTTTSHSGADVEIPAEIVEAVTGKAYWDYVQENVFERCGMTGSAFYTRPQWLTDTKIAHPYMTLADGSRVDAIRNLDKSSGEPDTPGRNPGRMFIDAPGDGGFATAPDLVRFAQALGDGTLLERPYADLLTGAKIPLGGGGGQGGGLSASAGPSFMAYDIPVHVIGGQWVFGRAGANPGIGASWNIYPNAGWVGVILANCDPVPLQEMSEQEVRAVIGQG